MTICLRVARLVQELDSQSLLFIPLVQKETPIIVSLCEKCLVADVRSTVGQYLQLNKTSLDMFGLFVGKLECPTKHIPDEVLVIALNFASSESCSIVVKSSTYPDVTEILLTFFIE